MNAFGETRHQGEAIANRFPGQLYDAETGLHYNWFRSYGARAGRYNQADPIGLGGGANFFAYAHQNPNVFSDPSGTIAKALAGALIACGVSKVCQCIAIYGAYKKACGFDGCKDLQGGCCEKSDCRLISFRTTMAALCYSLRSLYIARKCDNLIPTTKDHRMARQQALEKYVNCQKKQAECAACA